MQNPTERPAESLDSISPAPGQPVRERERQTALQTVHRLRKEASAEIERLIAFMDETDGYTTHEREEAADDVPCDTDELEKSFSGVTADGHNLPCNVEDELEGPDEDNEPSLGSVASYATTSQEHWVQGLGGDVEDEHDGCEPDDDAEQDRADDEPSLGWTVDGVFGNADGDREQDGYNTGRDVREARERGRSNTPGVSVDTSRGYTNHITGLTARQKELLGTEWLRR
jgi:hypothetical protein